MFQYQGYGSDNMTQFCNDFDIVKVSYWISCWRENSDMCSLSSSTETDFMDTQWIRNIIWTLTWIWYIIPTPRWSNSSAICLTGFNHSHKKRKDSLESQAVFAVFFSELEIFGMAVQRTNQNSEKGWLLWGIPQWKCLWGCFSHFLLLWLWY